MQQTILRPILLPPLNDIYRPRSALGYRPEAEDVSHRPSSSRNASEKSPALTSTPMTRSTSQPLPQQTTIPSTEGLSDFAFPFHPRSQTVAYEEDYSNWKPNFADPTAGDTSSTRQIIPTQTWPLALEALVEPDPPFAAEDRHYCITPTESRLSTITEEGTVRDSVVITPSNISNLHDDPALTGGTRIGMTDRVRTPDEAVKATKRLSGSSQESVVSNSTVQRA